MAMCSAPSRLPFWQVNVPEAERTHECPEFLVGLSDKDRAIIGTPDSEYRTRTWAEVRKMVATNQLQLFQRRPSELRRYRRFIWELSRRHGGVMEFMLEHRLRWRGGHHRHQQEQGQEQRHTLLVPSGAAPFADESDVRILCNDWPYGIDERIVHLVVWTKFDFELETGSETGDLSDRSKAEIDAFVRRTFMARMPEDHVCVHPPSLLLFCIFVTPRSHSESLSFGPACMRDKLGRDKADIDGMCALTPPNRFSGSKTGRPSGP